MHCVSRDLLCARPGARWKISDAVVAEKQTLGHVQQMYGERCDEGFSAFPKLHQENTLLDI